jgi:hypothetical protein
MNSFFQISLRSVLIAGLSGFLPAGSAWALPCYDLPDDPAKTLKVFLNCPNSWCWQDYLRTQTTWAYFVQDQFVADVNLRINSLENGSGGSEYKLIFEGIGKIAQLRDTVKFSTNGIQTDNEVRDILLKHIQLGLVRYAMQAEAHDILKISSTDSSDQKEMGVGSNPLEDPFNAWVYNVNLSGNGDGQKSNRNLNLGIWFSAGQVKETHRLRFSGNFNTRINRYDYEGEKSTYRVDRYRATLFYVKSLNLHWSLGCFNGWSSSTFDNLKNGLNNSVALEYNLFPYNESQTRQLTASLFAGSLYNQYLDTTIFFRKQEWRPQGRLVIQGMFNPSWGSASIGINNIFLLDDVHKLSSSVYCSIDARIFKGLSVSLYGSFSLIRNQINLPKVGASIDQVLLSQQVIATNYSYDFYASLSYRFGSIFNNVVNTRFQDEF